MTQAESPLENLVYDSENKEHGELSQEVISRARRMGGYIQIMMDHQMPGYEIKYQIYKKEDKKRPER